MKYLTLTAAALVASLTVAHAGDVPMTRQKACSVEFQKLPKETRGGMAGWQTFYKECNARLKTDGNTYAKRSRSAAKAD